MVKMGSFDTDYFVDLKFIKFFCNNCHNVNSAEVGDTGKPVKCYNCGEYLIVPKNRFAPSVVINDFVLQNEIY